MSSIILGTAQFGMDYGISNSVGKIPYSEAEEILKFAGRSGVRYLDTAIAYGDSETVLGRIGMAGFDVITKLPIYSGPVFRVRSWLRKTVEDSRARLGIERHHCVMMHDVTQYRTELGIAILGALVDMRLSGQISKVGISIYDPSEVMDRGVDREIDIIQAPANILDRRLVTSDMFHALRGRGVEFHCRSVFLQGLLLMPQSELHPYFYKWKPLFSAWNCWLEEHGMEAVTACIGYMRSLPESVKIVVGVETVDQLKHLVKIWNRNRKRDGFPHFRQHSSDPDLINPAHWNV